MGKPHCNRAGQISNTGTARSAIPYFKDAGLTEVITKEQTVLAPTGEAEPSKPEETPSAPTDPPQDKPDKTDDTTESPQTGDSSDMALWISLMLASCGGVLGMLFYRRKKAAAGK